MVFGPWIKFRLETFVYQSATPLLLLVSLLWTYISFFLSLSLSHAYDAFRNGMVVIGLERWYSAHLKFELSTTPFSSLVGTKLKDTKYNLSSSPSC